MGVVTPEQKRAYDAARYAANREKRREQIRRWNHANSDKVTARRRLNPEKQRQAQRRCYLATRERWLERCRRYYMANKEQKYAACRRWAKANPDKVRAYSRKYLYGLTHDEQKRLLASQANACAICRRVVELHVDHDHESGSVRGLLCKGCNSGLGYFRDDIAALQAAIEYLLAQRRKDVA